MWRECSLKDLVEQGSELSLCYIQWAPMPQALHVSWHPYHSAGMHVSTKSWSIIFFSLCLTTYINKLLSIHALQHWRNTQDFLWTHQDSHIQRITFTGEFEHARTVVFQRVGRNTKESTFKAGGRSGTPLRMEDSTVHSHFPTFVLITLCWLCSKGSTCMGLLVTRIWTTSSIGMEIKHRPRIQWSLIFSLHLLL